MLKLGSSLSGWYLGNGVFSGLIHLLIVDPMTGAMYNLTPDKIEQPLSSAQTEAVRDKRGLMVVLKEQTTEHGRAQRVRVN